MTELLTHTNGVAAPAGPPSGRDFSRPRPRITFTIDNDEFEAAPVLPGDIYAEFVTRYNGTAGGETYQQRYDTVKSALQLALLPESWERFAARLADQTHPIDEDQMADVVLWLLETYGLRPTQPSQPSSDGPSSPASGTSSTEEQQPQASTPPASPPTAS